MRFLVVGRGARRQAITQRLLTESPNHEIWARPGLTQGQATRTHSLPNSVRTSQDIASFAKSNKIELAVFISEQEIFSGLPDFMRANGIPAFGPSVEASRVERDRLFTKTILAKAGVRTPVWRNYNRNDILDGLKNASFPCYAKVNSMSTPSQIRKLLTFEEGLHWYQALIVTASDMSLLLEEPALGSEASVTGYTDGNTISMFPAIKCYKTIDNGDVGPNTGGMGAVGPVDGFHLSAIEAEIFRPILGELRKAGITYRGAITADIIAADGSYSVLELNVHLGDPETTTWLPMLATDYGTLLYESATGRLASDTTFRSGLSVATVTVTTRDYPYPRGIAGQIPVLTGILGSDVFHYDTLPGLSARYSGGRILSVRGSGKSRKEAADQAYARLDHIMITLPGEVRKMLHYRTDIGG